MRGLSSAASRSRRDCLREHTNVVLVVEAAQMLGDLAAQPDTSRLRRRLRRYTSPALLLADEVGYMSYGQGYNDLLFQVVSQRYQRLSTIVTTNRIFREWQEVLPSATSIVALIDRLCHNAERLTIDADSYRNKEALECNTTHGATRRSRWGS